MVRLLIFFTLLWCLAADEGLAASLSHHYQQARKDGQWHQVTDVELELLERLMPAMLQGRLSKQQIAALRRSGWDWYRLDDGRFLLREKADQHYGRGLYLFDPGDCEPVFFQFPHSFYDLGTGRIGLALADLGDVKLMGWNTVQRYSADGADLAHTPSTVFQTITQAFVRSFGHGRVIQLHGFSNANHGGTNAGHSSMILSNGNSAVAPASLVRLRNCLRRLMTELKASSIMLYPVDTAQLGATTNIQGRFIRREKQGGFVHLELNGFVRKLLQRDDDALSRLSCCLLQRECS